MSRIRKFTDTEKWCNGCRSMRPRSVFNANKRNASGLQDYCREHTQRIRDHRTTPEAEMAFLRNRIADKQSKIIRLKSEILICEMELKWLLKDY
jgi:hypothetical protein